MIRPFEASPDHLRDHLDEMVDATFADIESQFLVLPRGPNFVEYRDFQSAYEVLKRHTSAFAVLTRDAVWAALRENSLCFLVLRTTLGMTPPEWADLARSEGGLNVPQGAVRTLDSRCRAKADYFAHLARPRNATTLDRIDSLLAVSIDYLSRSVPVGAEDTVHRLDKVDTSQGLTSLQHAAAQHVPYSMLLYERH